MKTGSPRRRRLLLRLLLGFVLLLLLAAGAAALILPGWAADQVGEALQAAARGRGLEVRWSSIEVSLSGDIEIGGLHVSSRRGGLLEIEIDRLQTHVTWEQAWRRERPHHASAQGMTLRADLPGLAALRESDAPASSAPDAPSARDDGARLEVTDLAAVVHLDPVRTVACRVDRLLAELDRSAHLEADMSCRASDLGIETGRFHVDARYVPDAERTLEIALDPSAEFHAGLAGADFGRVRASLGPDGGSVVVESLALSPQNVPDDLPLVPRFFELERLTVELERTDGELSLSRLEAGPGRLALFRPVPQSEPIPPGEPALREEPPDEDENGDLPLEEAADQARAEGPSPADWTLIEEQLSAWTALASAGMARATSLTDHIEVHDLALTLDFGDGDPLLGQLHELSAVPGRAELRAELEGHPIEVNVSNVPEEHALTLELTTEGVSLDALSRLLGRDKLFSGHIDAHLTLRSNDSLALDVTLDAPDLVFYHPAVSPQALALLPLHLEGQLRFAPGTADRLVIEGRGQLGDALRGEIGVQVRDDDGETQLDAEFNIDETDCAELLRSIPSGLFVHMPRDEIRFAGRAGFDGDVRYVFGQPRSFRLRFGELFPGTCEIVSLPEGFEPERLLDPDYVHGVSAQYLTDVAGPVHVGPGTEGWVPLEELPAYVPASMYFSEQRLFYDEPSAVSVRLLNRAVRVNLMYGRWAYGGSTVTQQLVKNLFLDRDKSLARKLEEAIIAWAVFSRLSLDEILALYVNCIEFGPDVWGIEAAARFYFGVGARELTPVQTVFLAGLKPSPRSGGDYRRRGQSPSRQRWRDRIRDRLTELAEAGYIDPGYIDAQAPFIIVFPTDDELEQRQALEEAPEIVPID